MCWRGRGLGETSSWTKDLGGTISLPSLDTWKPVGTRTAPTLSNSEPCPHILLRFWFLQYVLDWSLYRFIPQTWKCTSSPDMGWDHSKVTPVPGRAEDSHTSVLQQSHHWTVDRHLVPPVKASQETTQKKHTAFLCYCISGKHQVWLRLSPRWPQSGPLTTQGENTAHNRQRKPLNVGLKAKVFQPQH